jgi:hypothetical protein
MPTWLESITSPLSAASEGVQKLIEVRDLVKFGDALGKLQAQILAAQSAAMTGYAREAALLEEIGGLKKRVAELEAWEAEKERYELVALAPKVMAYAVKQTMRGADPPHYICANCYNSRRKSFLNQITRGTNVDIFQCNACGERLTINKGGPPASALPRHRWSP